MNAFITTKLGSVEPLYYACGECGMPYHLASKGLAEQCCSPALLRCMVSGCETKKEKGRNVCKKHGDEHTAEVEAERQSWAETVVEYEQVTNGKGDYWADVDDYTGELEPGTPEHFLWASRRVPFVVSTDRILDQIREDWWQGEEDAPDLIGVEAFKKACADFEHANSGQFLLEPDYTKKVHVPRTPSDEEESK